MNFQSKSLGIYDEHVERIVADVLVGLVSYGRSLDPVLIALEAELLF
jgi:hypothetical protein